MGNHQSLLKNVIQLFNKGNRKYLHGDLITSKECYYQCLTMLKNSSEINEYYPIHASILGNIGCIEFIENDELVIQPKNVHPIEETPLALENFLSRKNIGKTIISF